MPVAQTETRPSIPTLSPTIPPVESDECIQEQEVEETGGVEKEAESDEQGREKGNVEGHNLGEVGNDEEEEVESKGEENNEVEEKGDDKIIEGKGDDGITEASEAVNNENEEKVEEGNAEEVADEEETGVSETEPEVGETENVPGSAEVLTKIVVLDEETEIEETPIDERTSRRNSRVAWRLDEGVVVTRARQSRMSDTEEETGDITPEAQETTEVAEEIPPEILEERYETKRRLKGKQEAKISL